MITQMLLPDPHQLHLEGLEVDEQVLIMTVSATSDQACCPDCGSFSQRIHSRYQRCPRDLPCAAYQVCLKLHIRRFFCDNDHCNRVTFAERLLTVLKPYARCTNRLRQQQQELAFTVGGEAGARLLRVMKMPISPDTILRLIRKVPEVAVKTPRVLGVDDWASRKGQTYGTLLVDLERQQPVDLLPARSAEALAAWLQAHPGVEIISRDRGNDYIKGATLGAPQALQVADRWHLLKNLHEAVERQLQRDPISLKAAADAEYLADQKENQEIQSLVSLPQEQPPLPREGVAPRPLTKAEQDKQARRVKRLAKYEAVIALHKHGLSYKEIASHLKMDAHTVSHYVEAGSCPFYPENSKRSSQLDQYRDYMSQRWQTGCHNATQIWRELGKLGFTGSRGLVAQWAAQQRKLLPTKQAGPPPKRIIPWASGRAAWLFIKAETDLKPEDRVALDRMRQASQKADQTYLLAQRFVKMVQEQRPDELAPWLEEVMKGSLKGLIRFANGLKQDFAAVHAALSLPWSNGQTEGQINRLKLIKRSMYGRARFDLLRKRVLYSSIPA